jgi:hypothetical protein
MPVTPLVAMLLAALALMAPPPAIAAGIDAVVHETDTTPLPTYTYSRIDTPESGDTAVAFQATLQSATATPRRLDCVVSSTAPGVDTVLACKTWAAPAGGTYSALNHISIGSDGTAAWDASVKGGRAAIFAAVPGAPVNVVVRMGDPYPREPPPGGGVVVVHAQPKSPIVTKTKGIVFKAFFDRVPATQDQALLRCYGGDLDCSTPTGTGTLVPVVTQSEPIANRPGKVVCGLHQFDASDYGVVFVAQIKDDCASLSPAPLGVYVKAYPTGVPPEPPVQAIAIEDELVANLPGTTRFDDVSGKPAIDDGGVASFRAETAGTITAPQIFVCDPGVCPAAPPRVIPKGILDDTGRVLGGFSDPVAGGPGLVAFMAKYTGGCGVYVWTPPADPLDDGAPVAVVRKADVLAVENAAFQCSRWLSMSSSGRVVFLSDMQRLPKGKHFDGIYSFSE